ncbi:MAG: hypothetical protein RIQ89_1053 [Bacteroidota bacterium]|jgi:putative endonuclease
MSEQSELGKLGEELACKHLLKLGYEIMARNYSFAKAEVDIIARFEQKIIIVEVKTRNSEFLNDPSQMVSLAKQKQIIKAADAYMKEQNIDLNARFDIVSIVHNKAVTSIDHIEGAFFPSI